MMLRCELVFRRAGLFQREDNDEDDDFGEDDVGNILEVSSCIEEFVRQTISWGAILEKKVVVVKY